MLVKRSDRTDLPRMIVEIDRHQPACPNGGRLTPKQRKHASRVRCVQSACSTLIRGPILDHSISVYVCVCAQLEASVWITPSHAYAAYARMRSNQRAVLGAVVSISAFDSTQYPCLGTVGDRLPRAKQTVEAQTPCTPAPDEPRGYALEHRAGLRPAEPLCYVRAIPRCAV